jgi:hypothetical protein
VEGGQKKENDCSEDEQGTTRIFGLMAVGMKEKE